MNHQELVKSHIIENIQVKEKMLDLIPLIEKTAQLMALTLKNGNKILSCGNGGSANDAQHFATELINRFEKERDNLAALALTTDGSLITAIGNDYHFDEIFAKQIKGLGKPKDILLAISTSGNSKNVLKAIEAAHAKDMIIVGLSKQSGQTMQKKLKGQDIFIGIPSERTARVQEGHLLVLHSLCDLIDHILF
ncbi:MAG: phosphoheptose isomerase [Francisellaceae bacterium]|nr:phosphoheptose isomerase [Francisellaceae bacterium]